MTDFLRNLLAFLPVLVLSTLIGVPLSVAFFHVLGIIAQHREQRRRSLLTRVPQTIHDEIEQSPAWWDREFAHLLRTVEPPTQNTD